MSTQPGSLSPKPISIHIPHSLQHYAIPLPHFLATNPEYDRLVCSAFIFTPPLSTHTTSHQFPSCLLLLQRTAHDTHYPSKWEVPGGSAKEDDPTILHSLAREVFEETGLRLTRLLRQVGEGMKWTTEEKDDATGNIKEYKWLKLSFHIEVAEIAKPQLIVDAASFYEYLSSIPLQLDPEEHEYSTWASEDDIGEFVENGTVGEGPDIVSKEQAERMLMAFELKGGR
ncbi:MAG: hypothetical protein Q9181_001443 [Wetmoreana brouardii]